MTGAGAALDDDALARWVAEGKTQVWIAEKVGLTQGAVSKRIARLGLKPSSKRGRPRNIPANNSSPNPAASSSRFTVEWREEQLRAALNEGRITPSSEPIWRGELERDPAGTAAKLSSLAAIPDIGLANRERAARG